MFLSDLILIANDATIVATLSLMLIMVAQTHHAYLRDFYWTAEKALLRRRLQFNGS